MSDSVDLFDPVPDSGEVEDIFAPIGTVPGPVNPNPVIVAHYKVFLVGGRAVTFAATGVWAETIPL